MQDTNNTDTPQLDTLAGQLRAANKLAASGDDMSETYRRLGHALRHASDELHQRAGDVMRLGTDDWLPPAEAAQLVAEGRARYSTDAHTSIVATPSPEPSQLGLPGAPGNR